MMLKRRQRLRHRLLNQRHGFTPRFIRLEENSDSELNVTRSACTALNCEQTAKVLVVSLSNAIKLVSLQRGDVEGQRIGCGKTLRKLNVEEVQRQGPGGRPLRVHQTLHRSQRY